jgi:hypothetical protein
MPPSAYVTPIQAGLAGIYCTYAGILLAHSAYEENHAHSFDI